MAPQGLPSLLALSFPTKTDWQTGHRAGGSDLPPHYGERKPDLGSSPHPRRVIEARVRDFRTNRIPIPCAVDRRDGAAQQWRTFLRNHRDLITGMDFFTVITANFRILYCLFLIRHDRREIIHLNVTEHPTGEWVVQQLREAFPENTDKQYLIFDRDAKFSAEVHQFLDSAGTCAVWPAPASNDGRVRLLGRPHQPAVLSV